MSGIRGIGPFRRPDTMLIIEICGKLILRITYAVCVLGFAIAINHTGMLSGLYIVPYFIIFSEYHNPAWKSLSRSHTGSSQITVSDVTDASSVVFGSDLSGPDPEPNTPDAEKERIISEIQRIINKFEDSESSILRFSDISLVKPVYMQLIGKAIKRKIELDCLQLINCQLDFSSIDSLHAELRNERNVLNDTCEIKEVDIICSKNMGVENLKFLGYLLTFCRTQAVNLSESDLNKSEIESLKDALDPGSLVALKYNRIENLGFDEFKAICKFIKENNLKSVEFIECGLTANHIKILYKELSNTAKDNTGQKIEIESINISNNEDIGTMYELYFIKNMIKDCKLKSMSLCCCGIGGKLNKIVDCVFEKLRYLDLSRNSLDMDDMEALRSLISKNRLDHLGLSSCELTAEKIDILTQLPEKTSTGSSKSEASTTPDNPKISSIDLSYNSKLDNFEGWTAVVKALKMFSIQKFNAAYCLCSVKNMECLNKCLGDCCFETLNICVKDTSMNGEYLKVIKKYVRCASSVLEISCENTEKNLRILDKMIRWSSLKIRMHYWEDEQFQMKMIQ